MGAKNCVSWLLEILQDGKIHLCDDVRSQAKKEGFSSRELKQARKKCGVKTFHQFDEYGATENWFWYLEKE